VRDICGLTDSSRAAGKTISRSTRCVLAGGHQQGDVAGADEGAVGHLQGFADAQDGSSLGPSIST